MSIRWRPKHPGVDVIDVLLESFPRRLSIVETEELSQLESRIITDKTRFGCREYVVQQTSSVGGRQHLQSSRPF